MSPKWTHKKNGCTILNFSGNNRLKTLNLSYNTGLNSLEAYQVSNYHCLQHQVMNHWNHLHDYLQHHHFQHPPNHHHYFPQFPTLPYLKSVDFSFCSLTRIDRTAFGNYKAMTLTLSLTLWSLGSKSFQIISTFSTSSVPSWYHLCCNNEKGNDCWGHIRSAYILFILLIWLCISKWSSIFFSFVNVLLV